MTEGQDLEVNGRIGQNTWERDKTGLVLAWHLPSEKTSVSHNKGNSKCDVTVMENWADHTAWVSSTDKKGDKKQQMGHVFPKTMLQDTGLLCSNEMVVPSCHALARTLAIPWIKERHAQRLEKQQANRCRQIHVQKSTEKQSHSTPPPQHAHTLTSTLGHHPQITRAAGWGGREGGEGSCCWDHGIQPGRRPVLLFLLVRLCLPGGRRGQESAALRPPWPPSASAACTCRAGRQPQPHSSYPSWEGKRAAGAICRAMVQYTCNSGLKLHLFVHDCKPRFGVRSEHLAPRNQAPCSWVAETIQPCARPHYLQNAAAALTT